MYKKKKGSLELSANAIVILIIAITILGLGLGFVKNLFSSLAEKIGIQAESIDFSEPPTADRPISMVGELELPRGKEKRIKIGFYNNKNCGDDPAKSVVPQFEECVGEIDAWDTGDLPIIVAAPSDPECGQEHVFNAIIKGGAEMQPGTSVCTVVMDGKDCFGPSPSGSADCVADPTTTQIFLTVP